MADALNLGESSLRRWLDRRAAALAEPSPLGRPKVIPLEAAREIRKCYQDHFCQWGPQVLAWWCKRKKLGDWCASTIAEVIADLREDPVPAPVPVRYEVTASEVMWSEDGTGFKENGRKKELLVLQDEHSRFKLNHRLTRGPACEEDVVEYVREAFERYGAPLVLKHDGGSIFHGEQMIQLLSEYQVLDLTGPRAWPGYNGKKERSFRDVKCYVRAMRRHGAGGTLSEQVGEAIEDLNLYRPRPVLGGRTAREVLDQGQIELPDRQRFRKEVEKEEQRWLDQARSRAERDRARRRAIEAVLLSYKFLEISGDVSRNCEDGTATD